MEQKNDKNDFFDDSKFLQLNQGYFLWNGTFDFSEIVLNALPFCESTSFLVTFIFSSNYNLIIEEETSILLLKDLQRYNYNNLAVSVIYYYIKTISREKKFLAYHEWEKVISGLLQPNITDSVLFFLEKFNIINFLLETETENQFIAGALSYFQIIAISAKSSSDLKEIKNLLKFLKVDQSLIESLVKKTYTQANFKDLTDFLIKYRFNDS